MNTEYLLKPGDLVTVNFNNSQVTLCKEAEIIYIPVAPGDSWIFRDRDTGKTHYVSEGCTVSEILF